MASSTGQPMVIRFESFQKRLLRADAVRRRGYVERVRRRYGAWEAGRIPISSLCRDAGDALREYASETLGALLVAAHGSLEPGPAPWVLDVYHDGISRAGVAMRDAIADLSARHAVAQALQEQMLRAETHLYQVMNSSSHAGPRP